MDAMNHSLIEKKALIMTAVAAERDAVLKGLGSAAEHFDVLIAGVGPVIAAVRTASQLSIQKYAVVISAGIGGGFVNRAPVGSLVIADQIVYADLGAETPDGFQTVQELGFGENYCAVDLDRSNELASCCYQSGIDVAVGPILTVSTVTGTAASALELSKRVPGAAAEAMEGYGVAMACHHYGIPVMELRAISNEVGPRNREAWRIGDALDTLALSIKHLLEVI